jgi:hypothetical protein
MRELKALGFDSYEAYLKSGLWHQFKKRCRYRRSWPGMVNASSVKR